MKKFIKALIYGDSITKKYLWGVLGLSLLTIVFIVAAAATQILALGILGVFAAFADMLWIQSMTLLNIKVAPKTKEEREKEKEEQKKAKTTAKAEKKAEAEEKKRIEKEKADNKGAGDKNNMSPSSFNSIKDEEELEKLLTKYKVGDRKQVVIDSCDSFGVYESPAYIWSDRSNYYLLIIGQPEGPIRLKFNLHDNMKLYYSRGVKCSPAEEYRAFKRPSLVSSVFNMFLPDYYQKRTPQGITWNKNLYRLGKDMYFTNRSAKNVFNTLGASFEMEDEATIEETHGGEFKQAYKFNILWRDNVLTDKEYQEKINFLLSTLAKSNIKTEAYEKILDQMLDYNFITREYVDYYLNYKANWETKKS